MPDRRDSLRHDVGLVVFLALLVAVWQAAYSARLLPGYAFPSPLAVGRRLVELARDGSLGAEREGLARPHGAWLQPLSGPRPRDRREHGGEPTSPAGC